MEVDCFIADEDYRFYLDWLAEYATSTGCRIHAYALMTYHVHLLVSSPYGEAMGKMMKALGQRYVQYINRKRLLRTVFSCGSICVQWWNS